MKKILFLVLLSSIILMSSSVIAQLTTSQNLTANIAVGMNVTITPDVLDFGTVTTCSQNNPANNNILFTSNSDTSVNVEFTLVTAGLFQNVKVKTLDSPETWTLITSKPVVNLQCTRDSGTGICAPVSKSLPARLDVPCGTTSGTKSGVITYTITIPMI